MDAATEASSAPAATAVLAYAAAERADSTSTSRSAHRCLIAWKDPMGRPNWCRTLRYSTVISSTAWAPPTCSQASAANARSYTGRSVSQTRSVLAQHDCRGSVQAHRRQSAGLVHGFERIDGHPLRAGLHREQ